MSSPQPQSPLPSTPPSTPGYYNPRPQDVPAQPRVVVEEVSQWAGPSRVRTSIRLGTEGATSISSVFTLCNSAIGAGVLSLPYAFKCAGAVGCLLLCVVIAACEAFTMYVLAKFAERYSATSYGSLIRKALGRKTAACLSGILLVYLWGSCVAYTVIIGDTFSSLAAFYLGPESVLAQRHVILLVLGLGVCLPLCLPRNLSALEYVSMGAVLGFIYTAIVVFVRGGQIVAARPDHFDGVKLFHWDIEALYAVSIVVFGFNCHANVVSIFDELEHYPHRIIWRLPASPSHYHELPSLAPKPLTYKMVGMLGIIISAMCIIMSGYMAVGFAGYLAYPLSVSSNVLNSFPADDTLMQVARAVIGLVVAGHFPINHHPARASFEDLLDVFFRGSSSSGDGAAPDIDPAAAGSESPAPAAIPLSAPGGGVEGIRLSGWGSCLFSLVFVGGCVGMAMLVTDLGAVLHMIGGTAASFMIFLLPGLLLLNAAVIKATVSYASLSQLAADADAAETSSQMSAPLLHKKAGIRESGLIYSPAKSWWAGLFLVVLAGLVLAITLITVVVH